MIHAKFQIAIFTTTTLVFANAFSWPKDRQTADCQGLLDGVCKAQYDGCDGPPRARLGPDGKWGCFSPSALKSDNSTYNGNGCFSTSADSVLRSVAASCLPDRCKVMQNNFCAQECEPLQRGTCAEGSQRAVWGAAHKTSTHEFRCYSPAALDAPVCDELFSGKYCAKSASENCDGRSCTQVGRIYGIQRTGGCASECQKNGRCNFYSYTTETGDCLMYDKCPAGRIYETDQTKGPTTTRPVSCADPKLMMPEHYHSGECYCTREADLWDIASDCMMGQVHSRVFTGGESQDPNILYRIPAIVKTPNGTLVAFAEARHGSTHDSAAMEIATSRSTDFGVTWSPVKFATTGKTGNPMPFALADGTVVLTFLNDGGHGNGVVFSYDQGQTWSEIKDISYAFGSDAGASPGPGAGAVLDSGRLILPSHVGAYKHDHVTYSDDGGKTWTTIAQTFPKMDEPAVANLGNGHVILNFRNKDEKSKGRGIAHSYDGGLTWTEVTYDSALKGPVCQGSLAKIGGVLYFANPDSTKSRVNLTIKKSYDNGITWSKDTHLVQTYGSGGYTSLVHGSMESTTQGGILFESHDAGSIDFKTFPLNF